MEINYELIDVKVVAKQLLTNFNTKTILFNGEMGVGKTTLIKALLKELGCKDEISSPTFSIVNEYELENDKVFHFDLYRIKNLEEIYNFGIEDYIDSGHWILIEWPELIIEMLDANFDVIHLKIIEKNKRKLILNN